MGLPKGKVANPQFSVAMIVSGRVFVVFSHNPRQRSSTVVAFEWAHWLNLEFALISQGHQTRLTDRDSFGLGCRWVVSLNLQKFFGEQQILQGEINISTSKKRIGDAMCQYGSTSFTDAIWPPLTTSHTWVSLGSYVTAYKGSYNLTLLDYANLIYFITGFWGAHLGVLHLLFKVHPFDFFKGFVRIIEEISAKKCHGGISLTMGQPTKFWAIKTSWWLNQPLWKIWSSNWKSSRSRDENKKIFETTTQKSSVFLEVYYPPVNLRYPFPKHFLSTRFSDFPKVGYVS